MYLEKKKYFGNNRSTFIIYAKGQIVHSWSKVKVKDHVEEVISYIKENNTPEKKYWDIFADYLDKITV